MASPNLLASTDRSTPLSTRATDTPSPVARGSRSSRSGVRRRKMSSNTVSAPVTGGSSPVGARGFVQQLPYVLHEPDAVSDRLRPVPDRQFADGFRQLQRRLCVDDRIGRLVQPGPKAIQNGRGQRRLGRVTPVRGEGNGYLLARPQGGLDGVDQHSLRLS